MEICMHATHQAILCILFIVASWAHVNAQKHRSDENASKGIRVDTIGPDVEKNNFEQLKITLKEIKDDCKKLETSLIRHTRTLEYLEQAVTREENNTRELQKNIYSILDSQKHYEKVVNDFRSELAGVKHELVEDRNSLHQKFMAPLENLNQTVQLLAHKQDEAFSVQVAELKAEQQKLRALVLQETSQLRENYTSEIAMLRAEQKKQASAAFELFERSKNMEEALLQFTGNYTSKADLRVKRAISNKCSFNVHHKPEGGRIDLLMVMDPPNTDPAACN